jgi:hypothetical protein
LSEDGNAAQCDEHHALSALPQIVGPLHQKTYDKRYSPSDGHF